MDVDAHAGETRRDETLLLFIILPLSFCEGNSMSDHDRWPVTDVGYRARYHHKDIQFPTCVTVARHAVGESED